MRRALLKRLPRPVRWLCYLILLVLAAELAALAVGVVLGDVWLRSALEVASILAAPLALGLVVVVGCATFVSREPSTPGQAPEPAERAGEPGPAAIRAVPPEIAAGRAAGRAVAALKRSREGKVAVQRTTALMRAVRAAAQAPREPADAGDGDRDRPRTEGSRPRDDGR
jgi:hypothetical protein